MDISYLYFDKPSQAVTAHMYNYNNELKQMPSTHVEVVLKQEEDVCKLINKAASSKDW